MGKNIVQTARDAGTFMTRITAIDRASLASRLEGDGPLSVLAPSDEAFARLPAGSLDSLLDEPEVQSGVLTYQVVPGRVTAADAVALSTATTMHGEEPPVSTDGSTRVDGARVVSSDIKASDGVTHVIDGVLLPAAI